MARKSAPSARELGREAGEDLGFQVRSWRVQRIGWLVAIAVVGAALLGGFGHGPLAQATLTSPDGRLAFDYQRLARHGDPTSFAVRVAGLASDATTTLLWLDSAYLDGLQVEAIVPEPARVIQADGRTGFEFELGSAGSGLAVSFHVQHEAVFLRQGSIQLDGGPPLSFSQFVYP
jgi:hypothetical protein